MRARYYDYLIKDRKESFESLNNTVGKIKGIVAKQGLEVDIPKMDYRNVTEESCNEFINAIRKFKSMCIKNLGLKPEQLHDFDKSIKSLDILATAAKDEDEAYRDAVLFWIDEKNLLTKNTPLEEDFRNSLKYMEGKYILESLVEVEGNSCLMCRCNVTNKHSDGTGFKYYVFSTDIYHIKHKKFAHLSTVVFREGSDCVWILHADEDAMNKYDLSTIVINDIKYRACRTDYDIVITHPRETSYMCDSYALAMIRALVMGTQRYVNEVTSERKTVDLSGKRVCKVHSPREFSDSTQVLDGYNNIYVSMGDINKRKKYMKKPWQGGHHRTPVEHDVRQHERVLKSGKVITVKAYHKPCLGNDNNKGDGKSSKLIVIK